MIEPNQTETDGKGESEPIETTTTTEGKAKNRRVEFLKLKTLLSEFSEAFTKRMLEERKKESRQDVYLPASIILLGQTIPKKVAPQQSFPLLRLT